MGNKSISHYQQEVYINGERLKGVQSCNASWSAPEGYVNAIGIKGGTVGTTVDDVMQAEFGVERFMIGPHDPMINLFESTNINGEIDYGEGGNFSFREACINSYSCSCAVGELVALNFGITAYGRSGGVSPVSSKGDEVDDTVLIALPGSIIVDVDGQETNAVQSFDFQINLTRNPVVLTGSNAPQDYIIEYPIQVDCQFSLIVEDYKSSDMLDFICAPKSQNLILRFTDCASGDDIRRFFIPNAKVVDYNQSSAVGDRLSATFTYKSLIRDISDLKKITEGTAFS